MWRSFGHCRIIYGQNKSTDYIITRMFDRNYEVVIPERAFCKSSEQEVTFILKDGSKMNIYVGAIILCECSP